MLDINAAQRAFKGIDKVDPTAGGARGPKIKVEGKHLVEITGVHLIESKNPKTRGKVFYVVNFKVLETTAGQEEIGKDRVIIGKEYTWSNDTTNEFFGLSNTKQFVAAAAGLDPESQDAQDLGDDDILESLGYDLEKRNDDPGPSPLIGERAVVETERRETQSGFDFTVHEWSAA